MEQTHFDLPIWPPREPLRSKTPSAVVQRRAAFRRKWGSEPIGSKKSRGRAGRRVELDHPSMRPTVQQRKPRVERSQEDNL